MSDPTGVDMQIHYTFGGEKVLQKVTSGPEAETRLYLGGVEYKDSAQEAYYHADGRIMLGDLAYQYKLMDHLGNFVIHIIQFQRILLRPLKKVQRF